MIWVYDVVGTSVDSAHRESGGIPSNHCPADTSAPPLLDTDQQLGRQQVCNRLAVAEDEHRVDSCRWWESEQDRLTGRQPRRR